MSPLPPKKYGRTFLAKKLCMGEQTFFGKFMGGCFTWGLMIRSCKGGSYLLRCFKGRVKLVFPLIVPDLGYWYIIWKVNTTNRGLKLKNTFWTLCLWVWDFMLSLSSFFKKISGDLFFDVLIIGLFYICVIMDQTHGEVN